VHNDAGASPSQCQSHCQINNAFFVYSFNAISTLPIFFLYFLNVFGSLLCSLFDQNTAKTVILWNIIAI